MTKEEKRRVLSYLEGLVSGSIVVENVAHGLCYNITCQCFDGEFDCDYLDGYFESLEKFSGNTSFPILSDDNKYPEDEYYHYDNKYDKSTEYGRLRWELVDHIIECLSRELADD